MKKILCIKDDHNNSRGRTLAKTYLTNKSVDVFFIEWPIQINKSNIPASFNGKQKLNPNDAKPDLCQLAQDANTNGIDIVSCDLTVEQTVNRLNTLKSTRKYAPYIDTSVFQPWGEGVRDVYASAIILGYLSNNSNKTNNALLMFGSDHFKRILPQ